MIQGEVDTGAAGVFLRVSASRVRQLAYEGKLVYRVEGGRMLVTLESLAALDYERR